MRNLFFEFQILQIFEKIIFKISIILNYFIYLWFSKIRILDNWNLCAFIFRISKFSKYWAKYFQDFHYSEFLRFFFEIFNIGNYAQFIIWISNFSKYLILRKLFSRFLRFFENYKIGNYAQLIFRISKYCLN